MDAYKVSFDSDFKNKRSQNFVEWLAIRQVRVRELNLLDCDAIPLGLMCCSSQITKIHLTDCHFLSNLAFISLIVSVPLLKELKISNCHMIGDASFVHLSERGGDILSKLERLVISDCAKVRDRGLIAFFSTRCRQLKTFSISGCKVTEKSLVTLLTLTSSSLISFKCEECLNVTEFGSIFRALTETVDDHKVSALQDFTLDHKALIGMGVAVEHVTSWLPSMTFWEACVKSPLRLRVVETEGVDDFAIQVRFLRGSGLGGRDEKSRIRVNRIEMGSPDVGV
jgi:hypothetical protein